MTASNESKKVEGVVSRTRRFIVWSILWSVCALSAACGDVREVSGVYTEELTAQDADSRAYALRLTIFEYDHFIGGWVEYYALTGINQVDTPYVLPTACAYFGPLRRAGSVTVVRAAAPGGGPPLLMRLTRDGRRMLHAEVAHGGGIFSDDKATGYLEFRKRNRSTADRCPSDATILELSEAKESRNTGTTETP